MKPYALQRNPTTRKLQRNRTSRKLLRAKTSGSHCCTCTPTCPEIPCAICTGGKTVGTITATVVDVQIPTGTAYTSLSSSVKDYNAATRSPWNALKYCVVAPPPSADSFIHLNGTFCTEQKIWPATPPPPPLVNGQQTVSPFYCPWWRTNASMGEAGSVRGDFQLFASTNAPGFSVTCTPETVGPYAGDPIDLYIELDRDVSAGWIVTIWGFMLSSAAGGVGMSAAQFFSGVLGLSGGILAPTDQIIPVLIFTGAIGDNGFTSPMTVPNTLGIPDLNTAYAGGEKLGIDNNLSGFLVIGQGGSVVLTPCCDGEYYP